MIFGIKSDLYRYVPEPYSVKALIKGFRSQGFRYMFFWRLRKHFGKKSFIGLICKLLIMHYRYKFGFQIGGDIGPGFYIGHFGTIVSSVNAKIGNNCNIAHGVTIGAVSHGKYKGAPIIGDRVWMGTNSVIVGNIKIGNDVLIAPGAFVNRDVPSHSIVIGNPAKVKHKEQAIEGYINNTMDER